MSNFKTYKAVLSTDEKLNLADAKIKFKTIGTYIHPDLGISANISIVPAFPPKSSYDFANKEKDIDFNIKHMIFPCHMKFYEKDNLIPTKSKKCYLRSAHNERIVSYDLTNEEITNKKNPFRKISIFDNEIYDIPVSSNATLKDIFQILYWLGYDKFIGPSAYRSYLDIENGSIYKINDPKYFDNNRLNEFNSKHKIGTLSFEIFYDNTYFYNKEMPVLLTNYTSQTMTSFQYKNKKWVQVPSLCISSSDISKGFYTFDMLLEDAKRTDEYFSIYDKISAVSQNKLHYNTVVEQPATLVFNLINLKPIVVNGANEHCPRINLQFNESKTILSYLKCYLTFAEIKFIDLVKKNIIKPRKTFRGLDYELYM